MINFQEYEIFKGNITNLKDISKDDSDKNNINYMTESLIQAIDFDSVKTKYANDLSLSEESATSVDGLFSMKNSLFFIEFKNGNMKNEKRKVKDKIRDSLLVFCDITGKHIKDTRTEAEFILVYNMSKNPMPNQIAKNEIQDSKSRFEIAKYISKKANTEFVRFGLEVYKRLYFKDVHTFSTNEFERFLLN